MATTVETKQQITDISSTASGLIEKTSLQPILVNITDLLVAFGIKTCADVTELQALSGAEVLKALVLGVGLFTFDPLSPSILPGGTYPATGGGVWVAQNLSAISSLLDVVLTNPVDTDVLKFNASTGKWENSQQTITTIGFVNISGVPTFITRFNEPGDGNVDGHNIGVVIGTGDGNTILAPNDHNIQAGDNSIVISAQLLTRLIGANNSVILHTGGEKSAVDMEVDGSILIGDHGDVDDNLVSGDLVDVIAIGTGGKTAFEKDVNGNVHLGERLDAPDVSDAPVNAWGQMSVRNAGPGTAALDVDGVFSCTGMAFTEFNLPTGALSDCTDDTDAASNGVPIGGVYHTAGAMRVRIA